MYSSERKRIYRRRAEHPWVGLVHAPCPTAWAEVDFEWRTGVPSHGTLFEHLAERISICTFPAMNGKVRLPSWEFRPKHEPDGTPLSAGHLYAEVVQLIEMRLISGVALVRNG